MNRGLKSLICASGIAAGGFILGYGFSSLSVELLFNRNAALPEKFVSSVIDCDSERLKEVVENNINWVENYGYEKHYIISDRGEKLVGRLLKHEKQSNVYVLGVHGYRGNGKRLGGMTRHYIEKGYNVLLPDHVASGESEGTYCTLGVNEMRDCLKWLNYMTDSFGKDIKIILHGVSMGAAVVMFMAGDERLPQNVRLAIEDCGYTSLKGLLEYCYERRNIKSGLPIKCINYVTKRKLGFDFYDINPIESVKKAKIPIMFIHGTDDGFVPSFMVHELYEACPCERKQILKIDGADHAQSLFIGGERYFSALDSFIEKNI